MAIPGHQLVQIEDGSFKVVTNASTPDGARIAAGVILTVITHLLSEPAEDDGFVAGALVKPALREARNQAAMETYDAVTGQPAPGPCNGYQFSRSDL